MPVEARSTPSRTASWLARSQISWADPPTGTARWVAWTRPSQSVKVPSVSAWTSPGSSTSAWLVVSLTSWSTAITNARSRACSASSRGPWSRSRSTPARTSTPSSPAAAAATMAGPSRPGASGSSASQASASSPRAVASPTGRPPGSSPGRAPTSRAPRSPARRGTQANRPPSVAASRAAAASPPVAPPRQPASTTTSPSPSPLSSPPASPSPRPRRSRASAWPPADRDHRNAPAQRGLAQPQPQDGRLLVRVEVDHHDRPGRLQVPVGRHAVVRSAPGHLGGGGRAGLVLGPGAGVHVVGAQRDPGQLLEGVGVLVGEVAADQHPDPPALGRPDAVGGPAQRLGPGGGAQLALLGQVRDQHPLRRLGVGEAVAAPVAVPGLVDVVVVAGQLAGDQAPAGVDAQVAAGRAVVADPVGGGQVERPGLEPVRGRGQRPHRADLDDVAAVVARIRLVLEDGHLLQRPPLEQLDERVAGDLV